MISLNRCLQPPAESYVPQGATLYCNLVTSRNAEQVLITYRFVDAQSGNVRAEQVDIAVNNLPQENLPYTIQENMPECFLIGVSARAYRADQRGLTFASIMLKAKDGKHLMTYLRGYVTMTEGLNFPPVFLQDALSGRGASREELLVGDMPEFYHSVAAKTLCIVKSIYFGLTTSDIEGDRLVVVRVINWSPYTVLEIIASATQPPGTLGRYTFLRHGGSRSLLRAGEEEVTYVHTDLGQLEVHGEHTISVFVLDPQAGDVAGECWLHYEQLLEPDMPITI